MPRWKFPPSSVRDTTNLYAGYKVHLLHGDQQSGTLYGNAISKSDDAGIDVNMDEFIDLGENGTPVVYTLGEMTPNLNPQLLRWDGSPTGTGTVHGRFGVAHVQETMGGAFTVTATNANGYSCSYRVYISITVWGSAP